MSDLGLALVAALDDAALERLAELLGPRLVEAVAARLVDRDGGDRWLCTRDAAEYAGCTPNALHKAMAAHEVHFEQDVPGGKAWFKRSDIDAWRRG